MAEFSPPIADESVWERMPAARIKETTKELELDQ